jgi:hypothetical protein
VRSIAFAALLALAACGGGATATPAEPAASAEPTPVGPEPGAEPVAGEDPCVTECVAERQRQATSIEQIRAACQAECEAAYGQGDGEEE